MNIMKNRHLSHVTIFNKCVLIIYSAQVIYYNIN